MTDGRDLTVHDPARTPLLDGVLAYGAMLPFPVAFALGLLAPAWSETVALGAQVWGAALLLFFSGVRRGLSFRTPGGATAAQLAAFAVLFCAGIATLLLPALWALVLVAAGLGGMAVADPAAARRGEAPLYFASLRPPQLGLGLAGLAGLIWLAA
jgi:hypothetical protein